MTPLLRSRLPIVAAPMAGGPSTTALARAVASAGAFPFLAGGYKSAETLKAEVDELQDSVQDFGVNLFVPSAEPVDEERFAAYAEELGTRCCRNRQGSGCRREHHGSAPASEITPGAWKHSWSMLTTLATMSDVIPDAVQTC
ncbi:hypothetical protein G3H63_07540 [Microbacterium resistens]|uniref:nitronate monooxygenase n=1 Tax=Microbacterium resistens TaxID=156977 RepID=UPI001C562042|nr:nitronate monooxygenase [Microbacterium resistens]MBW1638931.1 hypothetical protein [Microbacterium resistens]